MSKDFTIIAVVQDGRLAFEALLFMASLRAVEPDVEVHLFEPQPGPKWGSDPRISDPNLRRALLDLGAKIRPIDDSTWAEDYPNGNKIDALRAASDVDNFVFFDTDTLFLKPLSLAFPFQTPTASLRRQATWPKPGTLGYKAIWTALYAQFGLDISSTLDPNRPEDDWQRYLYFNAGFFCGAHAQTFGKDMWEMARAVETSDLPELKGQALYPWLDQIVLPLAIAKAGGGRNPAVSQAIDEDLTCHWRVLGLFYAREADWKIDQLEKIACLPQVEPLLSTYPPFERLVYQGAGRKLRADLQGMDKTDETSLRKAIKAAGLWLR